MGIHGRERGLVANPLHPLSHCNNVEKFLLIVCTKRLRQRNQTFFSLPILTSWGGSASGCVSMQMIGLIDIWRSGIDTVQSADVRSLAMPKFRPFVAQPSDSSEHVWQESCYAWAIEMKC